MKNAFLTLSVMLAFVGAASGQTVDPADSRVCKFPETVCIFAASNLFVGGRFACPPYFGGNT